MEFLPWVYEVLFLVWESHCPVWQVFFATFWLLPPELCSHWLELRKFKLRNFPYLPVCYKTISEKNSFFLTSFSTKISLIINFLKVQKMTNNLSFYNIKQQKEILSEFRIRFQSFTQCNMFADTPWNKFCMIWVLKHMSDGLSRDI